MDPLHVVFFNRSFYPETTATGQLLTDLCEGLVREHGCRVSVVAAVPNVPAGSKGIGATKGFLVQRGQYKGIDVLWVRGTRFSKQRFIGRFCNYASYFLSACYAGFHLDRPHVVVALTDPPIIGLAAFIASRWFRIPFVMSYRDIFPEVARLLEDFHSPTVERILHEVNCFLLHKAERSIALGETMRRRLIEGKRADPAKLVVIPDWADCFEITPGPKKNPFSLANGLAGKFVVMHSGNMGLSQDLGKVVEAAAYLKGFSDIRMVFVGGGVKKPDLQGQAHQMGLENVQFLPFQPKKELQQSFATADIFLISLRRGLAGYIVPSKLYGTLAAGRPYVAAVEEESEVTTITKEYECGLCAEPGNPQDIAEKILMLYRDRRLAERLGANARRAAFRFDRSVQVAAYHDLLRQLALISSSTSRKRDSILKRIFDILLSGLGLLFSAPLWGLIAILVKLEDGGPVFYSQQRVGRGCRRFLNWKFRSMVPQADTKFGPLQAKERDPRVTGVGRILRATAIDELPQLWSIFVGNMSFVGPRALLPKEIEVNGGKGVIPLDQIPGYEARHAVRPGLTGLAQVYAPRDVPRRNKFRYDLLYIRKQNIWLDLKLIALSFWITFRGKWEFRGIKI